MRQVEVEEHVHHHKVHVDGRQVGETEQAEDVDWYEDARVRVQAVIEEFAQRTTSPGSARLLAIQTVQGVGHPQIDRCQQPQPVGNETDGLVGRRKVVVVVGEEEEVEHGQQEAGERHHVGRHPSREEFDEPVPERVHNMHTEYGRVHAVVLHVAGINNNAIIVLIKRENQEKKILYY